MVQVGDPAPDSHLQTTDGQIVSLAEAWRSGRQALLIFLRHLG